MPRDVVNAILDRVNDADDLVQDGLAASEPVRRRMKLAVRGVLTLRGVSDDARREAFRRAFVEAVVASVAPKLPDAFALVRRSLREEAKAVRTFGAHRLKEIPALRQADAMKRRAEKALGPEGEKGGAGGSSP